MQQFHRPAFCKALNSRKLKAEHFLVFKEKPKMTVMSKHITLGLVMSPKPPAEFKQDLRKAILVKALVDAESLLSPFRQHKSSPGLRRLSTTQITHSTSPRMSENLIC